MVEYSISFESRLSGTQARSAQRSIQLNCNLRQSQDECFRILILFAAGKLSQKYHIMYSIDFIMDFVLFID